MTGQNNARMIRLAELWQRKSQKSGKTYFSGFLGDCQLVMFREGEKHHPTRPDETVIVWKLFVQERDPARRPQRRPTPGQAMLAAAPTNRERSEWNTDPGQHDTPNGPNDEIPF